MPMPKPKEGETEDDFIGRCMSDETMMTDYPDKDQRLAVCYKQWEDGRSLIRYRNVPSERADIHMTTRAKGDSRIVGYAAVYYDGTAETEYDMGWGVRERIMPGAFDETLEAKDDIRALFNHDPSLLLGRTTAETLKLWSDDRGLGYEIRAGATNVARDVIQHIERGDLTGSSFSFRLLDDEWHHEDGGDIVEIKRTKLYDVGPVTYPAYEATETSVRSAMAYEKRVMEQRIKVWRARRHALDDPKTKELVEKYKSLDVDAEIS
jgi:HK97 family phage prohead protease